MRRFTFLALRATSALDHWLRERLTLAGWVTLGTAAAAAAAGLDTNQTVTYRAFTFLAALLLVAWGVSLALRPRLRGLSASREMPRYATAGEPFNYRVTVVNRGAHLVADAVVTERFRDPRPAFEEFRRVREPGEERRNWWDRNVGYFRWRWLIERRLPIGAGPAEVGVLAPGERASLRQSFVPRRRGRLELAGLTISRGDPIGLVKSLALVSLPARIIALPKRYRLPEFVLPGRRKYQPGGVSLAASVGDSEEFLALRDYRPGDPLQRVHWRSFARTGKPVVKEYQDEFFERHALVLDTGIRTENSAWDEAFEDAVALAASFVYTIDTQECLLDLLFVGGATSPEEPSVRAYTAGRGRMQSEHMLEVLAAIGPSDPAQFPALAQAVVARRATLSSVIVILSAWDESRRAFIDGLRAAGGEVRTMLVCRAQAEPSGLPAGIAVLHPGEIERGLAGLK